MPGAAFGQICEGPPGSVINSHAVSAMLPLGTLATKSARPRIDRDRRIADATRHQEYGFAALLSGLVAFAGGLGVNEHECQIGWFVGAITPGMIGAALDQHVSGFENNFAFIH